MKKKIGRKVISLTLLATLFLKGCGTVISGDNTEASGSAVSGSSTDVTQVSAEGTSYYSNSTNYYISSQDVYGRYGKNAYDGMVQFQNDGKKIGEYKIKDFDEIYHVDDTGVYFLKWQRNGNIEDLWYVPVVKGENGDEPLEMKKAELLIEDMEDALYDFYWNRGRYFWFFNSDGDFIQYDRKTKEMTVDKKCPSEDDWYVGTFGDDAIVEGDNGLFRKDLNTGKWKKICGREIISKYTGNRNCLIYEKMNEDDESMLDANTEVWMFDSRTNADILLCTSKDMEKKLTEAGVLKSKELDYLSIVGMWCEEDSVYIEAQLNERKGKLYQARFVMFRVDMEKQMPVYEKKLTELIWENSTALDSVWRNYNKKGDKDIPIAYRENAGRCFSIVSGKAFLMLARPKKKDFEWACVDLSGENFRLIKETSAEFYELQKNEYPLYDSDRDLDMVHYFKNMDIDGK
ncbi:MAG: hypothetical protein J1F22_05105 [Lachnospiraceae bacterium]|nr:hypothetical protein [Lachnospiraceae bacterium]